MDLPWPRDGDRVFVEGGRATHVGTRAAGPHELGLMADGFKSSSDLLIQHLQQEGRNDGLVCPIIFGYRQYLELRIKALVVIVSRCDYSEDGFRRTHDLQSLWNTIRPRLWDELQDDDQAPFQVV